MFDNLKYFPEIKKCHELENFPLILKHVHEFNNINNKRMLITLRNQTK